MGRIGWVVVWVAGWLGVCGTVGADSPQEPVALDTVLVSPRRLPGVFLNASSFAGNATVLTAEQIHASGATTVPEVLSRMEGIVWSDQQGFGLAADGTVNLRGIVNSSRTNVLVLVDGVRQNRFTGDEVHWQSIPIEQIERIEIIRGGGGLVYGEGALAGVINIFTKQDADRLLETEQGAEIGSFGWQQYHLSARGRRHPASYGINYSRRLVDGYREFSWSRNTTVTAHTALQLSSAVSGAVHVLHSEDTTAFPGGLTLAQTQARRIQTNPFHGINTSETDQISLDVMAGPWEGLSSVVNLFWKRRLQASEDSINFNAFTTTPSRGVSLRTNAEWLGTSVKNLLVSGVELLDEKATTGDRDLFPGPDSESHRKGYGLYAEDTFTVWDRLSVIGGLRFDKFHYEEALTFPDFTGTLHFEGWSPKLAIAYSVIPEQVKLFASYARPFKAPNVDDLSARTPDFPGNADLKPQQADTYEVGAALSRTWLHAQLTGFYTRIDDEILVNGLNTQNQNFDTRRIGIEASLRMEDPSHHVRSYLTYTFVDAEFRKGQFNQQTIPGTPEHTLNASVGVSPLEALWVDLSWQLVHDFFRINDMQNRLGGADNYGVLNLLVQYEMPERLASRRWPRLRAYVKVENLTNEEYVTFQSSNGSNLGGAGEYPMPPTTVVGGLTMTF